MKKHDFMPIEKYYALKRIFENLWGSGTYLKLKHCTNLNIWKQFSERTLRASEMSILETISVVDDYWKLRTSEIISLGIERVNRSNDFDDLFEALSASYIELSFHQIGFAPNNKKAKLRKADWKLDDYRSVQYVQSSNQKQNLDDLLSVPKKSRLNTANN